MAIGTTTSAFGTNIGTNSSVTFASNGTALIAWYDGTSVKASYASAPYTSWTTLTVSAAGGLVSGQMLGSSDTVHLVFYVSGGLDYVPLTLSGTTYSVGSPVQIASVPSGGNSLMGCLVEKDPQARYWAVATNRVGSSIVAYTSSTPTTAGWTTNHSVSWSSDLLNNFPAGGIVGNYLLFLYPSATSTFQYQRLDVHGSTLGSWSAATAFTPGGSSVTNDSFMSFRGTSTVGVEANSSGSGIWARVYTASTDTWATAIQLSTTANDTKPTVIAGSDGNLYVVWQAFVATNNYALVYKAYYVASSTWDSSPTTLVASGANNVNSSGGSNNGVLGVVYQTGTASPYTINVATLSLSAGSSVSVTESLSLSEQVTLQASSTLTESLSLSELVTFPLFLMESLSLSERVSLQGVSSLTEILALSEDVSLVSSPMLSEPLPVGETLSLTPLLLLSETLAFPEQVSLQVVQTLGETLDLTEIWTVAEEETVGPSLLAPSPRFFAGHQVLPLLRPPLAPYAVNGVPLDIQPTLLTAPVSTGLLIPVGASFLLGFPTRSAMLLNLFISGTVLSLTFGLTDRSSRTARVRVQTSQVGIELLVSCMLVETSTPSVWVVPVQFV